MSHNPRILITNDDGVDAPGMEVAIRIAREVSDDVHVVAPAGNQSGVGHRFSFGVEMELERRDRNIWALDGTPADCVVAAMTHLFKDHQPDVVLSGVNNGQNLGDIINCSGTVAGAREAAMQGALGVAMSQAVDYDNGLEISWENGLAHGAAVLRALIAQSRGPRTYFNVNFPFGSVDEVAGIKVVPPQGFRRSPMAYYPSRNEGKFFIAIPESPTHLDPEADYVMLHRHRQVTVTPLTLDQSDHATLTRLQAGFDVTAHASRPKPGDEPHAHERGDDVRYHPDLPAASK